MGLPHEELQKGGTSGTGKGVDAGVIATMFKKPVYMAFKSKVEERDVYEDTDYISITCAGQKHSTSIRVLKDKDKKRFPEIWDAYQNNEAVAETGTAISELPKITRSRVLEIESAGFRTVEALAAVPDTNLRGLGPGGMSLKVMAKQFLEGQDLNSVKLEEANDRIAQLEKKLDALIAAEATANPAPKKKPGRPKKNVSADDSTERAE